MVGGLLNPPSGSLDRFPNLLPDLPRYENRKVFGPSGVPLRELHNVGSQMLAELEPAVPDRLGMLCYLAGLKEPGHAAAGPLG